MEDEMESMRKNAFELGPRPPNTKILNCKWIFKTKLTDGNIAYKARLVAQGPTQRKGQDYDETFSPAVRFESIRTLLALSARNKMHVHQMDIKQLS